MPQRAKVFWSGHSQAVRLPKKFRFGEDVLEVRIRREGACLVLEPVEAGSWPESFWDAFGEMPEGFERSVPHPVKREDLDF